MLRILPICLILNMVISCQPVQKEEATAPFVKGVYGNPATLLEAGYSFDSLGMNAVFVRSISLNRSFFDTAKKQGCRVFVEFPTLNGKEYLKDHPEAWPITETGAPAEPADWFMGICPTHEGFKAYRISQLQEILNEFDVDGIFLDYFHWHAQFETPEPILPETCFCDRCTSLFANDFGKEIPGTSIEEKASWILDHADADWRKWRNKQLNGWADAMHITLKQIKPNALLGVYYCAWYPEDFDGALYKTLGIDVTALAERADVLSPMLFHQLKDRPVSWVGEYLSWLDQEILAGSSGKPEIWPIVQAYNNPGIITPEEFREVMVQGSRPPATGIMMFSDVALVQEPGKVTVMKELYQTVLK
ncbi:MAG: family 10 glycosylhydrolase [Cyclobacteriaceae bacterium]|jgi:hypothetical protein|nr:family 10 glycosylhydrolase [Cyclobacteriaceae bacterium]